MVTDPGSPLRALIFANGELNDGPAVRAALEHAAQSRLIAADGGARLALACGLLPQVVVGDMDSLTPAEQDDLAARGALLERFSAEKDETDLELALLTAVRGGATWLRVIGAVGDRIDQTLANLTLLALPALVGHDVRLVAGRQTFWLAAPGRHTVQGAPGDTLSLIPLAGDALDVRTTGLRYPLRGESLRFGPARGVSNVLLGAAAEVAFASGQLVLVHTAGRA